MSTNHLQPGPGESGSLPAPRATSPTCRNGHDRTLPGALGKDGRCRECKRASERRHRSRVPAPVKVDVPATETTRWLGGYTVVASPTSEFWEPAPVRSPTPVITRLKRGPRHQYRRY